MDELNYVPKSFIDGQENLLGLYTDGILFVENNKELTSEEKDAIAQAVLKESAAENQVEKISDKITDRRT